MTASMHIGRAWEGHELEDACPCPKAACGLVVEDNADPGCPEHPPWRRKTMRQRHPADRCPAAEPDLAELAEAERWLRQHAAGLAGRIPDWAHRRGGYLALILAEYDRRGRAIDETAAVEQMAEYKPAAEVLTLLGRTYAAELGRERAEGLLAADTNRMGEWLHGNPWPGALPRKPLAEGTAGPDADGFVAYVGHRGVTRAQLPGLIGFLTCVLAAQVDDEDGQR